MSGTQPIGPIDGSTRILLSRISGEQFQLAVTNNGTVTFQNAYISDGQSLRPAISDLNLLYLTASGTLQSATFRVSSPAQFAGYYLSGNSAGDLILVRQPVSLTLRSSYSAPPSPYILFAGADYQFSMPDGTTLQTAVVIPTTAYLQTGTHAQGTATCASSNAITAQQAIDLYYCSIKIGTTPNVNFCQGKPVAGWTVLRQCQDGIDYTICRSSQSCGASNCYGACADGSPCDQKNGDFSCQTPGGGNLTDWWVWVLIGVVALVVIAAIIYALS